MLAAFCLGRYTWALLKSETAGARLSSAEEMNKRAPLRAKSDDGLGSKLAF